MDPLEMLTSPFKLTYRYSPLVRDLPAGLKRELRFIFGDHITFDAAERSVYNRDTGALPADLADLVVRRKPWAVVVPRSQGDLVEALRLAERHGLPVTPRGNGTSTNGAAIPAEGGIVCDMRVFDRIGPLDKEAMTVAVEPGVTFQKLAAWLAPQGLAPLVEPELPWASTVGGSVALGRHGFGSARWGSIGEQCAEAQLLAPDRTVHTMAGADLALVRGMQGTTGLLLRLKLKVGPLEASTPFLAAFDTREAAAKCYDALRGADPWHLAVLSPSFVELRQEASGVKGLQEKWHVLAVFSGDAAAAKARLEAATQAAGGNGKVLDDKAAQKEWGQRSQGIAIHRLGPTVVRAECLVPAGRLAEALDLLAGAAKGRACTDAFAASNTQALVRVWMLEDERRLEFPTSLGNLFAVNDAAHKLGGHAAYPSLFLAGDAPRALGEGLWKRLAAFKKQRDPWDAMNPGKIWPARMRGTLAPLPLFLKTQKPILKLLRGAVPYKGAEGERAGDVAVATALGKARGGHIAAHSDALYSCSHCGLCNTVSPTVGIWESERERGMVMMARALLEGEGRWTEHVQRSVTRLPLHRAGDAVCPSKIQLLDAFVAVRAETSATLGALPEHEAIAAKVAKDGN
ncbi:MAG TPA: FAD-binding oxidoreductase, partial [Candidatus Thermoplasmatota archaeon]|nr:FAD-binding oxidoreductase [Candidatus Thermoplasmatota archaeon]